MFAISRALIGKTVARTESPFSFKVVPVSTISTITSENNYQFTVSQKALENLETVKNSSNNVIEFLHSEGYIRFKADMEASSKALYEAYKLWCEDNARKPLNENRLSSELAQNERLYNVEYTNNIYVAGKRVRGFVGIEVLAKSVCFTP